MEGQECMIPEQAPCTSTAATFGHTNQGIGSYYDPTCAAAATASEEGELPEGCDPSEFVAATADAFAAAVSGPAEIPVE